MAKMQAEMRMLTLQMMAGQMGVSVPANSAVPSQDA